MAFIFFFFFFWKSLKKLKKLELSPQNFRYDVLHLLYSGANNIFLSVVQLKGKHSRNPHCRNEVVDTFWHSVIANSIFFLPQCVSQDFLLAIFLQTTCYSFKAAMGHSLQNTVWSRHFPSQFVLFSEELVWRF